MLKKTITFKDLDGNEITEDFYFNLSKAEIAEMELTHEGGFAAYLQDILASEDGGEIMLTFKKIVELSVGRRSEDGRRFVKSEEITQDFMQSDAYSELFMDLVTDANAAATFITGMMPADMAESVAKGENVVDVQLPEAKDEDTRPAWIREDREPTKKEMESMSRDELLEVFRRKNQGVAE